MQTLRIERNIFVRKDLQNNLDATLAETKDESDHAVIVDFCLDSNVSGTNIILENRKK